MKLYVVAIAAILFASCQKECPTCEEKECPTCEKPVCEEKPAGCLIELSKGLMAHYPFNGSFNDISGNNLNGQARNGATLTSGILGRPSTALGLDGYDDYVIVADNGKLSLDSVTISMFVMTNQTNRRNALLTRVNFTDVTALSWGVGTSLDGINKWEFAVARSNEDCNRAHVYDPALYATSNENLTAGQWYHLVTSFVNGVQKVYVDGVLRATLNRDFKTLKKCNLGQLVIGGWWSRDITSLNGKMDEVRIYNRGLSDCEIAELGKTFD